MKLYPVATHFDFPLPQLFQVGSLRLGFDWVPSSSWERIQSLCLGKRTSMNPRATNPSGKCSKNVWLLWPARTWTGGLQSYNISRYVSPFPLSFDCIMNCCKTHSSDQSFHLIPPKCSWLILGPPLFVVTAPSCMISAPAAQFCDPVAFAGSREPELKSRVSANGAVWDDGMRVWSHPPKWVAGFTSPARPFCSPFWVTCGTFHIVFDLRWPSNWATAKKTGVAVGPCGEHKKLLGIAGLRRAKQALSY